MASRHFTKREAQAVAEFAAEVMGALNMPGWRILVMDEPDDQDAIASITKTDGKYEAQLYLASDWMTRTDQDRREVIVHEVLHLLHVRLDHVIDDVKDLVRPREHEALEKRYNREAELMVDHLATFLGNTHTLEHAWTEAHKKKP